MHVKLEPNDQLDLPVELITDIESDLFREQLFGNSAGLHTSDLSESSSDDDQLSISRIPFNFELFADSVCTDVSNQWDPLSSNSSSPSGSFDQTPSDQTFSEFDFSQTSFGSDIDVEIGKCSPQDFIADSKNIKEESSNSFDSYTHSINSPSPNHIWDILCSNDVKPNIKVLETPPITPPESNCLLIDSPPTSPSEVTATDSSPLPANCVQSSRAIITVAPISAKPVAPCSPPRKKIALAPKIPFKVVTTITANENHLNSCFPRTIKVQPRLSSLSTPTVALTSSAGPRLNITRTGFEKCIKLNTKQPMISKPVTVSGLQASHHSTTVQSPIAIPSTINVSTCRVIPEQSTTRLPPIAPAVNPSLKNSSLAELRAVKRQQRMIKNRESASLSRKRKKEYLVGIEDKVRELDTENARLRAENERLHRRVTTLENEKVIMRAARFPIKRSSTAVLGLTFLFLFNMSPLLNIFKGKTDSVLDDTWNPKANFESKISSSDISNQFPHRSLLSFSPFDDIEGIDKIGDSLAKNLSYICPLNFNSTESLRVENELRDWFDSSSKDWTVKSKKPVNDQNRFYPRTNTDPNKINQENKDDQKRALAAPLTSVISSAAYQYLYQAEKDAPSLLPNQLNQDKRFSKGAISPGGNLQSLLESIERRNDTYYVVSLTAEHLLLPASAHNTSMRPKMSLLVPTPKTWNDHNEIGLMQIDCEVTHTKVIRWTQRTEEISVPSVPSKGSYPEVPVNNTEPESLHKEKPKRRKRKVL